MFSFIVKNVLCFSNVAIIVCDIVIPDMVFIPECSTSPAAAGPGLAAITVSRGPAIESKTSHLSKKVEMEGGTLQCFGRAKRDPRDGQKEPRFCCFPQIYQHFVDSN